MAIATSAIRLLLNGTSHVAPGLAGRQAFFVFALPGRRVEVLPAERGTHRRAMTEELTVNGKTVVVYRWGTGERPVLLLHGWRSRASRFSGFIDALEAVGLSPISFDAPGNGDSSGRTTTILEYQEIIGQLQSKYGEFESVIAHSFGVLSAFSALRNGLQAKTFVAIAGPSNFDFLVDGFCYQLGLNPRVKAGLRRRLERNLFPQIDDIWSTFDARGFAPEISIPILLIHDRQDPRVPFAQGELLKTAYGSQLEFVPTVGLGHGLLAVPAVVQKAVSFVAQPDRRAA
jgi:pimeloyl-ACP methyl ester carboxylesterase